MDYNSTLFPVSPSNRPYADLFRKRFAPSTDRLDWPDAFRSTKSSGGLPSNLRHSYHLLLSDLWQSLSNYYCGAWSREIIVYPQREGSFSRGIDIVDSASLKDGRRWVFPSSGVPEEAIGRKNIALFVDPIDIESTKDVVILAPSSSIRIIRGFPQHSGVRAEIDPLSAIPSGAISRCRYDGYPRSVSIPFGTIERSFGCAVKPIVRSFDWGGSGRSTVCCNWSSLSYGDKMAVASTLDIDPSYASEYLSGFLPIIPSLPFAARAEFIDAIRHFARLGAVFDQRIIQFLVTAFHDRAYPSLWAHVSPALDALDDAGHEIVF